MPAAQAPQELLELALRAARAAGALLLERYRSAPAGVATKSTPTDLVSDADHEAEDAIRALIERERPGDEILAEEGGARGGSPGGLRWLVDPLDGTVNFLYRIPQWSVSIACEDESGSLAAVVHDPLRGETFSATRGGPALLGDRPLTGSSAGELAVAMVATGFGYDPELRRAQARTVAALLPAARDIRRLGSAALDLAWTAAGRYDAYYERGLNEWDLAAGALLCERAGIAVERLAASSDQPPGLLAAPAPLIAPLRALVD